jgi:chitin synthase
MRYTACTCDPDDFIRQKYTLRQKQYGRQTAMAIVVTMYNENATLFDLTMRSIIKNIQHLQGRTRSKTWGKNSWEKIVVVIVADGRSKIDPRVLKMLSLYGCYQDGIAKSSVGDKDTQAHIYEYTSQVLVDHEGNVSGGIAPVQMCFVLKENNQKKLNSHR